MEGQQKAKNFAVMIFLLCVTAATRMYIIFKDSSKPLTGFQGARGRQ